MFSEVFASFLGKRFYRRKSGKNHPNSNLYVFSPLTSFDLITLLTLSKKDPISLPSLAKLILLLSFATFFCFTVSFQFFTLCETGRRKMTKLVFAPKNIISNFEFQLEMWSDCNMWIQNLNSILVRFELFKVLTEPWRCSLLKLSNWNQH